MRPIVTPWELLLALEGEEGEWDPTKWKLDLSEVLAGKISASIYILSLSRSDATELEKKAAAEKSNSNGHDRDMEFSLVTGKYRTRKTFSGGYPTEDGETATIEGMKAMTVRNKEFSLAKLESAGSEPFSMRS